VGEFLQYNDNTVERGLFYQAVHAVLEVSLDEDTQLEHYIDNFNRMFGEDNMTNVVGSISGEVRFFGLTPTSIRLEGLDKHQRLIESYKKLHQARKIAVQNSPNI
jgi:ribosomal protein S12 methylthiotransferase accessory factor